MIVKYKRLNENAKVPTCATKGSTGYDLYASEDVVMYPGMSVKIPTGLALEIPKYFCGVIYSRSSTSRKGIVCVPLIVDADYRGEVFISATLLPNKMPYVVHKGDRIAQLKIEETQKTIEFQEVEKLSETERGEGAFGSTGK